MEVERLTNCFYVDMASILTEDVLVNPRPFDGMAAGLFIDMWGREVEIKIEDLPVYVSNTKRALESTRDSNGAIVGFPIDEIDHRGDYAAGWIVDVNLSIKRSIIEFIPRWTAAGLAGISQDRVRYFSPSINIKSKVIVGGSLTNWPATHDEEQNILLRPIELGSSLLVAAPGDKQMFSLKAVKLFFKNLAGLTELSVIPYSNHGKSDETETWSAPTLNDFTDKVFGDLDASEINRIRDHYTWTANNPPETFADLKLPHHVAGKSGVGRSVWKGVVAAMEALLGARGGVTIPDSDKSGVYSHLSKHYAEFDKTPPEFSRADQSGTKGEKKMPELLDMSDPNVVAEIDRRAEELAITKINKIAEETRRVEKIRGFVAGLSAGNGSSGVAVDQEKTIAFLSDLPVEKLDSAMEMLKSVASAGRLDFTEHGHSRTMSGGQPLPDDLKPILLSWLSAGKSIAEFFKVNAVEVGAMDDYDLSEFKDKEKK